MRLSDTPQSFVPGQAVILTRHAAEASADAVLQAVLASPVFSERASSRIRSALSASSRRSVSFRDADNIGCMGLVGSLFQSALSGKPVQASRPASAGSGRASSMLFFGLEEVNTPQANRDFAREIFALDREVRGAKSAENGVEILGVVPNWLMSGSPAYIGGGGPGAKPVFPTLPAQAAGRPRYALRSPQAESDVAAQAYKTLAELFAGRDGARDGKPVTVAVLDTLPTAVNEAQARAWADLVGNLPADQRAASPQYPYYNLFRSGGLLDASRYPDQALIGAFNDYARGWRVPGHEYPMSDHGLFSAGIIHDIAPQARIHLVQVLCDYGVGSLEMIAWGFRRVIELAQQSPDTHFIINASLTLSIPRTEDELATLDIYPEAIDAAVMQQLGAPVQNILDGLDEQLGKARNVQIVAAAGNENRPGSSQRPPARYPAALPAVIGVGALSYESRQPAVYANISDTVTAPETFTRQGVATFGGDARLESSLPDAPYVSDPEKGVFGLYTEKTYPDGQVNVSGWASWSGSSFASPAIAGTLALCVGSGIAPDAAVSMVYDVDAGPLPGEEHIFPLGQDWV